MPANKPPAVNPNAIVFDPKGNAKEHAFVSRQDRRANGNVPMAERERRAAQARAEAEARESGASGPETPEPDDTAPPSAEMTASEAVQLSKAPLVRAPLGINETGDETPLEDVSGDDEPDEEVGLEEDEIEELGQYDEDDDGPDEDGPAPAEGDRTAEELSQHQAWQDIFAAAMGDATIVESHTHGYVPEPTAENVNIHGHEPNELTNVALAAEAAAREQTNLTFSASTSQMAQMAHVEARGPLLTAPDSWSSDVFQSFVLGDKIKVRNPVTGEPVSMVLISVDWDPDEGFCNVVYAPVQNSE
jgi:hypothetical protein